MKLPKAVADSFLFSTGTCGLPDCPGGAGKGGVRRAVETAEGGDGRGPGRPRSHGGTGTAEAGGGGEESRRPPEAAGGKQGAGETAE